MSNPPDARGRAVADVLSALSGFLRPGRLLVGEGVGQRSAGFIRRGESMQAAALGHG